VPDCGSGQDERDCGKEQFAVSNKLISTRTLEEDTVIEEISQEACAKFCRDEKKFQCVGFQHSLLSNQCRLLDASFSQQSLKPSLRGFWITFIHAKDAVSRLPTAEVQPTLSGFAPATPQNDEGDDDNDAVVVEVNFDEEENDRNKRQAKSNNRNPSTLFRPESKIQPFTCGVPSVSFQPPQNRRKGRIINGVDAPLGAYPWQVAIKLKDGQSLRQWCGGSILSDRLILTAAHCIDHLRDHEFVVVVGDHDTSSNGANEQVFEVEKYVSHPQFKTSKGGHDIALIKLQTVNGKGIVFGSSVQPICLPTSEEVYKPGTWCSVSGWGMQKAGTVSSASKLLKVASIPLLPSEKCNAKEVYGKELNSVAFPEGMVCAGFLEGGTDSCSGDSGGPLSCNIDGKFQLLGVVSWGEGCAAKNKPGVYTKVFHYINWIEEWSTRL